MIFDTISQVAKEQVQPNLLIFYSICIPDAVQMGEEVFEVFLIILNCPQAEVFDLAIKIWIL